MRQQRGIVAGPLRGRKREDVLEIHVRAVPVELRRADQAHDRSTTLPRSQ